MPDRSHRRSRLCDAVDEQVLPKVHAEDPEQRKVPVIISIGSEAAARRATSTAARSAAAATALLCREDSAAARNEEHAQQNRTRSEVAQECKDGGVHAVMAAAAAAGRICTAAAVCRRSILSDQGSHDGIPREAGLHKHKDRNYRQRLERACARCLCTLAQKSAHCASRTAVAQQLGPRNLLVAALYLQIVTMK